MAFSLLPVVLVFSVNSQAWPRFCDEAMSSLYDHSLFFATEATGGRIVESRYVPSLGSAYKVSPKTFNEILSDTSVTLAQLGDARAQEFIRASGFETKEDFARRIPTEEFNNIFEMVRSNPEFFERVRMNLEGDNLWYLGLTAINRALDKLSHSTHPIYVRYWRNPKGVVSDMKWLEEYGGGRIPYTIPRRGNLKLSQTGASKELQVPLLSLHFHDFLGHWGFLALSQNKKLATISHEKADLYWKILKYPLFRLYPAFRVSISQKASDYIQSVDSSTFEVAEALGAKDTSDTSPWYKRKERILNSATQFIGGHNEMPSSSPIILRPINTGAYSLGQSIAARAKLPPYARRVLKGIVEDFRGAESISHKELQAISEDLERQFNPVQ